MYRDGGAGGRSSRERRNSDLRGGGRQGRGGLGVSDPVKAGAPDAIKALKAAGLRLVMIPGYNRATAEAVARGLGIDEVHAEVLPQDKAAVVARLRTEGRVVAMVGDGGQRCVGARGG